MSYSKNSSRRNFIKMAAVTVAAAPAIIRSPRAFSANKFRVGYVGPRSGPLGIFGEGDKYLIDAINKNLAGGFDVGGKSMGMEIAFQL